LIIERASKKFQQNYFHLVIADLFLLNKKMLQFQMEDEKEHFEKELEVTKSLLLETVDEKKRLEVETDQLKSLLKREVAQFDSELVRCSNHLNCFVLELF
jgi:hypothetical protein